MSTTNIWLRPKKISDIDLAFPTRVDHLMPSYEDIPDDFKDTHNSYVKATAEWFCRGLKRDRLRAKNGINANTALRHLSTILRSFDPKHEHKEASVAFLMSCWFDLV